MSNAIFVCVGNCLTELSKEQFDAGNTWCKKKDCSKYKEPLVELPTCECGADCCMNQQTLSR